MLLDLVIVPHTDHVHLRHYKGDVINDVDLEKVFDDATIVINNTSVSMLYLTQRRCTVSMCSARYGTSSLFNRFQSLVDTLKILTGNVATLTNASYFVWILSIEPAHVRA